MKTTPFWTDDFPRPGDLPVSSPPSKVDVAIVGGGYTGLSAARVLARQGASVAVLESQTIGWGASSRNGGMATVGIKAPTRVMFRRYGDELGRAFWQASLASIDLVEQLVSEESIDCDFHRHGHLALASKRSHFSGMKTAVSWYKQTLNHELMLLSQSELSQEIGSSAFYGGLIDHTSGGLHPAKYVFGLARAAARCGAFLCEGVTVHSLDASKHGFSLVTNTGRMDASDVLVATNGYTRDLVPAIRRGIFPVGSYIIVTERLPHELQERLSPNARVFYDSKNLLNYFRLTPDGRMLFGGRNSLRPDLDLNRSAQRLQRRMLEVFPDLTGIPLSHSWTGRLGLSFDLMPHIGNAGGVHYAGGYCGHGVSIATYLGNEVGLMMAGKKNESPFARIPHPTRFYYRSRPWFLPFAAWYYRFVDGLP